MRFISPFVLACLGFLAELAAASEPHANPMKRRHHLSRHEERAPVQQNATARTLERRFSDARFTFYAAGLGACGRHNSGSDFIVALNSAQYAGGSHCFETITISVNGKTHSAEIVDECPGCPFGGLDFSEGLFTFFAPESVGVLTGEWNFGGSAAPPPPPPKPKPTTHTPPPPPKTTEHHTTSTFVPPPPTTSATTSSQSSKSVKSTSTTTTSTTPSATNAPAAPPLVDNIAQLYLSFVQIGSIVMAAPGAAGST